MRLLLGVFFLQIHGIYSNFSTAQFSPSIYFPHHSIFTILNRTPQLSLISLTTCFRCLLFHIDSSFSPTRSQPSFAPSSQICYRAPISTLFFFSSLTPLSYPFPSSSFYSTSSATTFEISLLKVLPFVAPVHTSTVRT